MMTLEQSKGLKEAFEHAADANGYISWLTCMQIAKNLGLEYEQVCVDALVLCVPGLPCCLLYSMFTVPTYVSDEVQSWVQMHKQSWAQC